MKKVRGGSFDRRGWKVTPGKARDRTAWEGSSDRSW
jgi:hypothetical protein